MTSITAAGTASKLLIFTSESSSSQVQMSGPEGINALSPSLGNVKNIMTQL